MEEETPDNVVPIGGRSEDDSASREAHPSSNGNSPPMMQLPPQVMPMPLPELWVADWVRMQDGTPVMRIRIYNASGESVHFIQNPETQILPHLEEVKAQRPSNFLIAQPGFPMPQRPDLN